MNKPRFKRVCPDCSREYWVTEEYTDSAYAAHARNEPYCVCGPCFDAFNGTTIEELCGDSSEVNEQ